MPIVCGIHPVLEALAAGSRTIERVVVTKGVRNKRILEVIKRASERGVPLRFEPREALDRAADGERHQGVLAIVAEKGLLSLEELQKSARTPALFMLLDGVEDPRNLGAIIRSVDAAGADGVILPDRHTASLSDAASRTAAGALESVKIARIGNVVQALETLKAKGFWIVGFDGSGKERWDAIDYKRPVVLVLGGEGKGIRRLVKENCDHVVSLPVFGQVSSLNVSVAAGIALYEAVRQRGTVPTLARPIPPRALAAKKPVVIGPPPEDREEDPGARRRAAAIASLSTMPERARLEKPALPAETTAGPVSSSSVEKPGPVGAAGEGEETESSVAEASVESITTDAGNGVDAPQSESAPRAEEDADDDRDGDGAGDDDADRDDEEDDQDEDGDGDDEGDGDDDGDDDEEGDEDDDEGDDDRDDDGGDEGDDDEEDHDDLNDEDEDQGDAASDLAAPFMPEDNSGGGEVTWGSEKELHATRPRREGERRFGNGGRRQGRPNDRNKKRPRPGGSGPAPQTPRPQGGGTAPGDRPQGTSDAPNGNEQSRNQNRDQNRDQNRNRNNRHQNQNQNQNRNQGNRGPDRNREPRPPQTGDGGSSSVPPERDPMRGPATPRPEGGGPADPNDAQSPRGDVRGPQSREGNGPGRHRNRRRRGGRGRNGGAPRPQGEPGGDSNRPRGTDQSSEGNQQPREPRDPNQPRAPRDPDQNRDPRPNAGDRPQTEGGGTGDANAPGGERRPREHGGADGTGGDQARRDRHRRRRRRGRRGPGGGQGNGGPGNNGPGGNSGQGGGTGSGNSGSGDGGSGPGSSGGGQGGESGD